MKLQMIYVDEVGRGCGAGPLTICGVIPGDPFPGVMDSKKYTEIERDKVIEWLMPHVMDYELYWADNKAIDRHGMGTVWNFGVSYVVNRLRERYGDLDVIIDGNHLPPKLSKATGIVNADETISAVGAASVIAKVNRDRAMIELHRFYPEYDFARNKGYLSKAHVEALKRFGPTPIHRMSFLKRILPETPFCT
jgi:ribonuclease HII